MEYGAIILAGGNGQRFNGKKQFIELNGKALWKHVYDKVEEIIPKKNIVTVGVDLIGGKTRSESVIKGLQWLPPNITRVIILEAARPLVTIEQIKILLDDDHPSSSFVIPLVNTVVFKNGEYINRDELYELLTPQAFDYKQLRKAYESGKYYDMTDETRVMYEQYSIKPHFIETGENLLKVTYKKDMYTIEMLLNKMTQEKET